MKGMKYKVIGKGKCVYENCRRDREWAEKQEDYVSGESRVEKQLPRCIRVVCSSWRTWRLLPFRLLCASGLPWVAQTVKNLPAVWETWVRSLGQEDPIEKGMYSCILAWNTCILQYSCLENPMDREAWWATVHGVAKGQILLRDWHFHFPFRLNPVKDPKPAFRMCLPTSHPQVLGPLPLNFAAATLCLSSWGSDPSWTGHGLGWRFLNPSPFNSFLMTTWFMETRESYPFVHSFAKLQSLKSKQNSSLGIWFCSRLTF